MVLVREVPQDELRLLDQEVVASQDPARMGVDPVHWVDAERGWREMILQLMLFDQ